MAATPDPPKAAAAPPVLEARGLTKGFTFHLQGGRRLEVVRDLSLTVAAGEVVALTGLSGSGKSTVLRMLAMTYRPDGGEILLHLGDGAAPIVLTALPAPALARLRTEALGVVTQFLRVVPRVPALELVADGAGRAVPRPQAQARARALLTALGVPERLWAVPPATFSGGEQQRINLARVLIRPWPVLLLDEPTASLDPERAAVVVGLIHQAAAGGAAVVLISHDAGLHEALGARRVALPGPDPGGDPGPDPGADPGAEPGATPDQPAAPGMEPGDR